MGDRYKKYKRAHKNRLYREQQGRCYYCGCQMDMRPGDPGARHAPDQFTFDHIAPVATGKSRRQLSRNVVGACFACNNERGDRDFQTFALEKQGALA